ncbi:unnamed protein product [Calicophoron daubneyi]|uniref:Sodium/calcium exchanger membrane region domain-containing protein n=1 Tax=Calicophoron daubneyi TaxID=300641 RepID=A0AAV2U0H7_CALDB
MLKKREGLSIWVRLGCLALYAGFLLTKLYFQRLQHQESFNDSPYGQSVEEVPLTSEDASTYDIHRHLLTIKVVRPPPDANCSPLAVENFPKDLFVQRQRQKGAVVLHIIGAVYMFIGLAILCDEYFIPSLARICEVLNIQPDVAGATFMAAGSSAPELATTLVGVFIAKDDIGLGAVVGSADFNIMLVVSVTALFAKQVIYLNWWPLVRDSTFYLISIIVLALVILDELIYWYEGLVFLILYGFYVLLMFFNPRLDAFWRTWCHNHPTCCPRAHHTETEELEFLHQHTGAFGHTAEEAVGKGQKPADVSNVGYEQFTGVQEDYRYMNTIEQRDPEFAANDVKLDQSASDDPVIMEVDTQVLGPDPDDSWFETCFSPLRLPPSEGTRAKLYLVWRLFVWPIYLVLCLTTPDVRKPKWRGIRVAHWITFVVSCIWIGIFTVFMMWMITVIGVTLHIPDTIMGLTFIAAGSSVPDAITSVLVVREGEGDMAVSNAIGSNVFDILICMGLPWFLKCVFSGLPVVIYSKGMLYATLTLFTTVLFLIGATHMNRWRLTKTYGIILLVGYIVVLIFCSCYELNLFGTVHLPECPLVERR